MPEISVCFASRARPESLVESVTGLLGLAADPAEIEVTVAIDPDDQVTFDALGPGAASPLKLPPQALIWAAPSRHGYTGLHHYLNALAKQATGTWLMWWNDDMRMLTPGWDAIVRARPPAVLWPAANHVAHANIAPIWPRAWSDACGHVSLSTHMDTWLQRVGEALGRHVRIPVEIVHDRADVTGGHNDLTYAEGRGLLGPEGMAPGGWDESLWPADVETIRGLLG